MRIGTSIVPALVLLAVAASDQVRAQPLPGQPQQQRVMPQAPPPQQQPRATPQAPPPQQQGATPESRRLGRSYPLPPPPIPQREPPDFYVAAPPSSIHRKVGEGRNNGSSGMGNDVPSGTP